jgi:hypothetical protein
MKDTALSEKGRDASWHVWINAAGERHGMCELVLTRSILWLFDSLWLPVYGLPHFFFFPSVPPHVPYGLLVSPPQFNRPVRRSYSLPMVIYEYVVPGGPLTLSSKLPRPWSPWESSPSRKNPHGRTGNRTRDLMISSQKLWPLDPKAGRGHSFKYEIQFSFEVTIRASCCVMRQ